MLNIQFQMGVITNMSNKRIQFCDLECVSSCISNLLEQGSSEQSQLGRSRLL